MTHITEFHNTSTWNGARERTVFLFDKIKSFFTEGMRFFELGCAYTYFPLLIKNNLESYTYTAFDKKLTPISYMEHFYRNMKNVNFFHCNMGEFKIEKQCDFLISIGCTVRDYVADDFHTRLLDSKFSPKYFLLETGMSDKDQFKTKLPLYYRLLNLYMEREYRIVDQGEFEIYKEYDCGDRYYTFLETVR